MILNENILRIAAKDAEEKRMDWTYINESLTFDDAYTYDLFISHSFTDRKEIIGLSHLFKLAGYSVYIDWLVDKNLDRNNVTSRTAEILKHRMTQSRGLAYVTTENISESKWCPWELGFADGCTGKACILPIMDIDFEGIEYLGIYPHLEYDTKEWKYIDFYIYDDNANKYRKTLRDWLNQM